MPFEVGWGSCIQIRSLRGGTLNTGYCNHRISIGPVLTWSRAGGTHLLIPSWDLFLSSAGEQHAVILSKTLRSLLFLLFGSTHTGFGLFCGGGPMWELAAMLPPLDNSLIVPTRTWALFCSELGIDSNSFVQNRREFEIRDVTTVCFAPSA